MVSPSRVLLARWDGYHNDIPLPWLRALVAVVTAAPIAFTDLAWRGFIGWPLLVTLLLVVSGGIRRGQQRRNTHRI
ncbi:hypothetical protein CIB50_0000575 [Kocuria varians]|uniref:Uncharacterized protein n=1 Tax=Kocuria varians TaxID=1272 RepID=A0A7D7Q370_KOCVA|nr:hypothetical protein CIB50_0000575 [Kocuria varians]